VFKLPREDQLEEPPDEGDLKVDTETNDRDSKDVPGQGREDVNHPPERFDPVTLVREHVLHSIHLLVVKFELIHIQPIGI